MPARSVWASVISACVACASRTSNTDSSPPTATRATKDRTSPVVDVAEGAAGSVQDSELRRLLEDHGRASLELEDWALSPRGNLVTLWNYLPEPAGPSAAAPP